MICGKVFKIKEIGNFVYKVINLSLKFVDSLNFGDGLEIVRGLMKELFSVVK